MTTTSAEVNVRPPQQRKHEELASLLGSRNVILGSTLLEPKKAPGTAGEKCSMKLITNAHILKLLGKQSIFHYEVTIFAVSSRSDRKFRVSEPNGPRDRDDFPFLSRRDKCREVFLAFYHTMEQTLKESGNLVYYDLSKTIFTLKKLKFESEGNFIFNIGTVPTLERPDAARYKHYEFNLTPATGFEIGDLSFVTNDVSKMERSLEQFLDIATVQKANLDSKQFIEFSSSRVYLLAPTDYGFVSTECPVFESNHSFLGIGMHKASRIIEGDQGPDQMTPAIVIQTKKSAFHIPDMSVLDKSKTFIQHDPTRVETGQLSQNDYEAICAGLTGIYAEPRYGTSGRVFRIDDITKPNSGNGHNAENTFITHRVSGNISVKQYFQDYCQKTIRFPKAPLLINYRRIGEPAYYPMEFCFILDGQRVKGSQQHPDLLREMIKETAVPPTVLQVHNERVKESLQLVNNEYLTNASINFDTIPLHVDYRVIGPPIVQYHNNQRQTPASSNSEWHQGNALIKAHINNWVAYGFAQRESDSVRRSGLNENMWRAFVDKYVTELQASGINCPTPRIAFCWTTASNDVLNILHKETLNNIDFALIGHAKGSEGDDVHVTIKAFEQQTEVVTQAISFDVVKEVIERGSPLTIANCINKTNVKMGGLNYALYVDEPSVAPLFDGATIFLGFAMNFPGGFAPAEVANHINHQQANGHLPAPNGAKPPPNGANGIATGSNTIPLGSNGNSKQSAPVPRMGSSLAPPSCIGWAASIGKRHKDEYIGDFVYQAPRREERIEVIANVVKRCVECFKQRRKNTLPKRLVILRNGCPEGQFEYIMKYEIPLVKKELEDLGCTAKLTVLVPNRLQDVRFLRQDANSEEKSNEQNIRPGTVVDTVVVHPKRTEFFLNSHVAIKGTARTPQYTVLMDENDLSMDTLQAMVHYLCFGHQIVTKPTSLPSPVYIANEYAKRGRNIYSHYSKNGIDHSKNLERFVKSKRVEWPLRSYEDMTKVLSYIASAYLKELRVNA